MFIWEAYQSPEIFSQTLFVIFVMFCKSAFKYISPVQFSKPKLSTYLIDTLSLLHLLNLFPRYLYFPKITP